MPLRPVGAGGQHEQETHGHDSSSPGAAGVGAALDKRIDLAASTGAGLVGLGAGALAGAWLRPAAVLLIIIGTVLHGWGMLARHQRERDRRIALPRWSVTLFWLCWAALLGLVVYLFLQR